MNPTVTRLPSPRWSLSLLTLFCVTLLTAGCGSDGGIGGTTEGQLTFVPFTVDFGNVVIGETANQSLTLINDGDTDIRLTNLTLSDDPTVDGDHEVFELVNPWDEALTIEPGEQFELDVEYTPQAPEPYNARITFNTNISDQGRITVDVRATTPAPELLAPDTVVFDRTPAGSTEWRLVRLENIGTAPLEITNIVLGGFNEADFDLAFPTPVSEIDDPDESLEGQDVGGEAYDRDEPQTTVAPGGSAWVRVYFTAPDESFKSTEIVISGNVPQRRIAVGANSDAACLELVGGDIDFGLASIDNTTQQTVTLRNCSRLSETVVTGLEIGDVDGDGDFQASDDTRFGIVNASLPTDLAEGGSHILDPQATMSFLLTYSPLNEEINTGVLAASSTDEASPLLAEITGEGANLECPVADARASIAESGIWTDSFLPAVPLDEIDFDGSDSFDPDNTQVTYEWSLVDWPMNSTAQIQDADTANAYLRVDIAGRFVVQLTVYDGAGIASCDPAEIVIEVEPESAIHVELTWDVPASATGTGTDLDLHYLHPAGQWSTEPYGVYWANRNPEWDDGSEISLDIDDFTGENPENINHDNPDPNYDYSVGVYYFADGPGYGATDARVRIFFHDSLVVDLDQRLHNGGPSSGTGDFWHVADIGVIPPNTPSINELQVIDHLYENTGFPSN